MPQPVHAEWRQAGGEGGEAEAVGYRVGAKGLSVAVHEQVVVAVEHPHLASAAPKHALQSLHGLAVDDLAYLAVSGVCAVVEDPPDRQLSRAWLAQMSADGSSQEFNKAREEGCLDHILEVEDPVYENGVAVGNKRRVE